jgi:hypothetical protein
VRCWEWMGLIKLGDRGQAYNTSWQNDSETHNEEKSLVLILMNFAKERLKVSADRCVSVYIVDMLYLHGEGDNKGRNENEQLIIIEANR